MFKKNTKSILNPSLPNPQTRGLVTALMPSSMPSSRKAPSKILATSITKQLLAKFENKYSGKVKAAKSSDSDISDSEPSAVKETASVKEKFTKLANADVEEEVSYESDFEASDSDVLDNEKSPAGSQAHLEEENSFVPKNIEEISEESIHENIFTFEELMKNNAFQLGTPAKQIINNEPDDIPELLESEIEENDVSSPKHGTQQLNRPIFEQSKNQENKSIEDAFFNENVVTFNELLSKKGNIITTPGKSLGNDKTVGKDSTKPSAEIVKEVEVEYSKHNVEDRTSLLVKSTNEVSSTKQSSLKEEEILSKKITSLSKSLSTSRAENPSREKEQRPKPKSIRKSSRQSLEENRRLERMFFLVEKQTLTGVVEQPVFTPLAMSWEREAELTDKAFDSQLYTPEDAFAEMLRLRLRLTRDKMAAEYAAYRSCCAATDVLAAAHQPVTLATTRQIISQLKQPDRSEPAT